MDSKLNLKGLLKTVRKSAFYLLKNISCHGVFTGLPKTSIRQHAAAIVFAKIYVHGAHHPSVMSLDWLPLCLLVVYYVLSGLAYNVSFFWILP